ncbi:hypothetical protein GCK72_007964 [Caenorhabditis remanei]|uniref:SET domain-containing protein n=1 Tax=Caenorhabditis remanei TaxID=31234 RepID=A0A6A5HNT4_CAERE|nr:hypothetical protein GCK72_007964 [Caenorhabditis remanei]KAF1768003.1 hypothetical protein GCK72_007964 [Caenorhabditis remanei]
MPHHPPPRIHPIPKLNEYSQLVTPLLAKLKPTPDADTLLQTLRHHRRARRMFVESQQEGLVAQEPVRVGQMIMEMNGYVALATEIATGDSVFRYDGLGLKRQICIDTSALGNDTKVTRRSCTPNSILEHVLGSGATLGVMIVAQKYIPRDDEVTLPFDADYKNSEVALGCAAHREDILACPFEQERRSTRRLNQERKDSEEIAAKGVPTSSTAPSTHTNYRSVPSRAERRKALQAAAILPADAPKTPSAPTTISAAKRTRPLPGNMGEDIECSEQGKENESEKKKDAESSPSTENNFLVQLDSRLMSQTSKSGDVSTAAPSSSESHQPASSATFEDTAAPTTSKVQISRRLSNRSQAISKIPTTSCRNSERKSLRAPVAKRPCPWSGNLEDEVVEKEQRKEKKSEEVRGAVRSSSSDNNVHVQQSSSRLPSQPKPYFSKTENVPTSSPASGSSEDPSTLEARHLSNISQRRSSAAPQPEDAPASSSASTATPSSSDHRLSNRYRAALVTPLTTRRKSERLIPAAKKPRFLLAPSTPGSRHALRHRLGYLGTLMKENATWNAMEDNFEPPSGCTDVTTCSEWAKEAPEIRREVEDQNTPGPESRPLAASSKPKSSVNKEPLANRRSQNREEPGTSGSLSSAGVRNGTITDVFDGNVLTYKRRRYN